VICVPFQKRHHLLKILPLNVKMGESLRRCETQREMLDVALALKDQGVPQEEILSEFTAYALWLRELEDENRENEKHQAWALEVADRLSGWCSPHLQLF
jgi:hypothetical protein